MPTQSHALIPVTGPSLPCCMLRCVELWLWLRLWALACRYNSDGQEEVDELRVLALAADGTIAAAAAAAAAGSALAGGPGAEAAPAMQATEQQQLEAGAGPDAEGPGAGWPLATPLRFPYLIRSREEVRAAGGWVAGDACRMPHTAMCPFMRAS